MKPLCLTLLLVVPAYGTRAQNERYARLADDAHTELFDYFRSADGRYYKENNGSDNPFFHYWWNAHALDVLVDAYLRTGSSTYQSRIDRLVDNWVSSNGGSLTNDYYDDMEWFTLALFRLYEATDDNKYLAMSTDLWDDIKTGKNDNQGGGIAWRKSQLDYKNTPANAPAIIYACRRHQRFGHTWELDLATTLYDWLKSTLVTADGRVRDGINRQGNGQIDDWQFTYNYGIFTGAALELYQSTGAASYLADAIRSADYAVQRAGLLDNGVFKDEGGGDGALFKGILVRYLALLTQEPAVSESKRNDYRAVLEAQAQSIHRNAYNRAERTIGNSWTTLAEASVDLSAQLSGMMMLEVAAVFNLARPDNPPPPEGGATYVIRLAHSHRALTFDGDDGANVHQWEYQDLASQRWVLSRVGGGYYELRLEDSSLILSTDGTTDSGNAYGANDDDTKAQRWKIIDVGGGLYSLENQRSGSYLDGTGDTQNGANVQVWPPNGSNAQKLRFDKVSSRTEVGMIPNPPAYAGAPENIRLYPNPIPLGDWLTLELPHRNSTSEGAICDATGQEITWFSTSSGRIEVPTDGLDRGMYLVRVIGDDTLATKKFFVK